MADDTENSADLSADTATKWQQEIARYEKWSDTWKRKGEKLLRLYARQQQQRSKRRFAMLWANTEVMKPSLYARPPIPQVSRRYKDKDQVGRIAAEILERSAAVTLEAVDLDSKLKHVRDDVLLPGRGTVWLRVEADDNNNQSLMVDYVHWKDFGHTPARVWEEVTAIWHIGHKTKEEIAARFGKETADAISYDMKAVPESSFATDNDASRGLSDKVEIYEIWDKTTKKVYFIAKSHPLPLEVSDPFLKLKDFWPCPKPLYATLTNESLIPTPDYEFYRDQAEEIDDLTARIASLTDCLKVVGFAAGGKDSDIQQALERALSPGVENTIIQVESWAAFKEGGGSKGLIEYLPLETIATTIKGCIETRAQLIQDVYQISGISDVLRGSTDPQETATAQSLKAQWGSVRIRDRQMAMAEFARDIVRIGCEIMADGFDFMALRQMANMMPQQPQPLALPAPGTPGGGLPMGAMGAQQPVSAPFPQQGMTPPPVPGSPSLMPTMQASPSQPVASGSPPQQPSQSDWDEALMPQVEKLIRDDRMRSFRIDIETDSTIQPDEDAEKQRRVEFIEACATFLQQSGPVVMQFPPLLPVIGEMLLFLVRGFRVGRSMEDTIDRAIAQLSDMATQAQAQPQTDPNQMKMQVEQAKAQGQLQIAQQKAGVDLQTKQATAQIDMASMQHEADLRARELMQDYQANQANRQAEMQHNAQKNDMAIRHAAIQNMQKRIAAGAPQMPGPPQTGGGFNRP